MERPNRLSARGRVWGERLPTPPAETTLVTGQNALDVFAEALGADTPSDAMRIACQQMRARVRESGRTPGLAAYLLDFGLTVEEAPIPTAGRLDFEDGRYIVRVQRTRHRGASAAAASTGPPRPAQPPTELRVSEATNRQRFTIAHEIGHAILFKSLSEWPAALAGLRDPAIWADVEELCDVAAGELLAPLNELLPLVAQLGVSVRGLERLADRFRVALEVVYARLLAAGAQSISLWRVTEAEHAGDDTRAGQRTATFVRALAASEPSGDTPAPRLDATSTLSPDIVLEAARHGRARSDTLVVTSGKARWHVAGLAACHEPHGARAEQPSLLGEMETGTAGNPQPPPSTQVTLLLLPPGASSEGASSEGASLWAALASV